ncbi:MAG: hypothetical protein JOY80_02895, partial [Candidatus Dormibacteraeota bacterium]|nr:hypothetical protein [Candidatus Dormibacteraeota bacterium]
MRGVQISAESRWRQAVAFGIVELILSDRSWLRRRTDRTVLLNSRRAGWVTELDIVMPTIAGTTGTDGVPRVVLPILFKRKQLLTAFEVRQDGTRVAPLTSSESAPFLAEAVLAAAAAVLGPAIAPAIRQELLRLLDDEIIATQAYDGLRSMADGCDATTREQASGLLANVTVAGLMRNLSVGFPVLLLVEGQPGSGIGVQVQHEEEHRGQLVLPAGSALSYHAELGCPDGVRLDGDLPVEAADLPAEPGWRSIYDQAGTDGFWQRRSQPWDYNHPNHASLVALHADTSRAPSGSATLSVTLTGWLRVAPGELGLQMRVVTCLTAALFAGGLGLRAAGIHPIAGGGGATLMVALLSVYAGTLAVVRPSQTQRHVTRKPRVAMTLLALLTGAGAAVLAVGLPLGQPPLSP